MPGSRIWYPPRGLAVQQMAAFRHTHNLVFTPSFLHRTIGWGASFRLSEKWPRLLVRRDQALSARTRCWSGRPKFGLARFVPPLMSNVECLLWPRATVRSWPTVRLRGRAKQLTLDAYPIRARSACVNFEEHSVPATSGRQTCRLAHLSRAGVPWPCGSRSFRRPRQWRVARCRCEQSG